MALLTIKNVSYHYDGERLLKNITSEVDEGDFITLFGPTGSGKSTLLKALKPALASGGKYEGVIQFKQQPLHRATLATELAIGYVMQNPNDQITMEYVWQELAFGLENSGIALPIMKQKIAEVTHFLGIHALLHHKTEQLSGGQKQLVNLASILVTDPVLLLLDEPTAQLDPIASEEFLQIVAKVNRELGITVIIVEHALDQVLWLSNRVWYMTEGALLFDSTPQQIAQQLSGDMVCALPTATQLYLRLVTDGEQQVPLTVQQGIAMLQQYSVKQTMVNKPLPQQQVPYLQLIDLYFKYDKKQEDKIKGLSLVIKKGEIFSIIGGNGSGKTTLLNLLAGSSQPYKGKILLENMPLKKTKQQIALLPQKPSLLFLHNTVAEELAATAMTETALQQFTELFNIQALLQRNPLDLSGGEQQKVALIKVLAQNPDFLLLDEPTKGMDAPTKHQVIQLLQQYSRAGTTIVMITHDMDVAATVADRCGMLFDHTIVSVSDTTTFFTTNQFYTTASRRISRRILANSITIQDILTCYGGK